MSEETSDAFEVIPLTYSSPLLETRSSDPEPEHFYNAFPEFNDRAPDGSLSAFPRRGKYSLALDSMFIPFTKWVPVREIKPDEPSLSRLPEEARDYYFQTFQEMLRKRPGPYKWANSLNIWLPKNQQYLELCTYYGYFETAHKLLAVTPYKISLRYFLLAPFYRELLFAIDSRKKISVPLRSDTSTRATKLQRHLAALHKAFKPTQVTDEVISLLVTIYLTTGFKEISPQEKLWIDQHEAEFRHQGFTNLYLQLRDMEKTMPYAENDASSFMDYAPYADIMIRVLGDFFYKSMVQKQERLLARLVRPARQYRICETMYQLLALHTVNNKNEYKFSNIILSNDLESFHIGLASVNNIVYLNANPTSGLFDTLSKWLKTEDKDILFEASDEIVFMEAMRQQICTGVGLRCPFWRESECCIRFSYYLQNIYNITQPYKPEWKKYWQKPPCLE